MDDKIFTALVASLTALITLLLKNWYDQKNNEKNALRDYEYEARKRLYQTYEPLFFQFTEFAEIALLRLKGIAKSLNEEIYKDEWDNFSNHYFRETTYKLFAPIALIKLIKDKLTSVDLRIDENLGCQYGLLKTVYFSFQEEYKIARIIGDTEYVQKWLEVYRSDSADIERQGLSLTELEKFLKTLIKETNGIYSILDIDGYEDMTNNIEDSKKQRSIKIIEKLFRGFSFKDKKILWILLVAHACIYYTIIKSKNDKNLNKQKIGQHFEEFFRLKAIDFKVGNNEVENNKIFEGAYSFLKKQVAKQLN